MVRHNISNTHSNLNQGNLDLAQNNHNPYYIHPSEGPSYLTITPFFNGYNYHTWKKCMTRALLGKNKLEFLDGSIPLPDTFDPEHKLWLRCNNLALYWIINSVFPSIAQILAFKDNPHTLWSELKGRFSQSGLIRIS